jgi:hypothetical protein
MKQDALAELRAKAIFIQMLPMIGMYAKSNET